jgi:hypothetical protein
LAYPVATTFTINPSQSSLTVNASSSLFSDSDSNSLSGTIDAVFDFGEGGAFPLSAGMTLTDAAITPAGAYALRLGFPPFLGVNITASNLLAHVTTPAPPATMTKTSAPGAVYQFDASQFLLTVDRGTIVVSGSTNETTDLSQEPVTGASPTGTLGTLTFTTLGTSGPYTHVGAALDLPIQIVETAESESGGLSVNLELVARVRANASFYVALSGVSSDFDKDGDVDRDDLVQWQGDFGLNALSDADNDGDSDGGDFLAWQRQFGVSAPGEAAVAGIPEPRTAALISVVGACLALIRRRHR